MKAVDILEVLSRKCVSSDQFGMIYVDRPMVFHSFVKIYLWHEFERRGLCDDFLIYGDVFYCYSDFLLDFREDKDLNILEIEGRFLYVAKVE